MRTPTEPLSRRWVNRALFVEAPRDTPVPTKTAHRDFVLTALLRRAPERPLAAFLDGIDRRVCDELRRRREACGIRSLRMLADASLGGALDLFLQFTRSYSYTAWLNRRLGRPAPDAYRIRYGSLYDAVVELTFAAAPDRAALDSVLEVLRDEALGCAERTILPSERQYTIYDAESDVDEDKRVNICFLVSRPAGMTRSQCQRYWRSQHADLALRNMRYLGLTRYLQVHTANERIEGLDDDFDGVVYAEKPSRARLMVDLMKPDSFRFNNTVVIDETNFTFCTPIMLLALRRAW